jgi:hypothetical protein
MNEHQQTAVNNHCRFAFETAQPQFCYLVEGERISIVLTVNSGYE